MSSENSGKKRRGKPKRPDDAGTQDSGSIGGGRRSYDMGPDTLMAKYITYNISYCENVHVGDKNKLVLEVQGMLTSPPESTTWDPDDVIIGMINSILNPRCEHEPGEMNFQKLETAFNRLFGALSKGKAQTFRDIAKRPMKVFLRTHAMRFELIQRDQNTFVKQRRHLVEIDDLETKTTERPTSQKCDTVISHPTTELQVPDIPSNSTSSNSSDTRSPNIPTVDESDWHQVVSKRMKKRAANDRRSARTTQGRFATHHTGNTKSADQITVEQLLKTETGPGLILHESETAYLNNADMFSLDIVSMWNTPRISRRILLGITPMGELPHKVTGLTQQLTNAQVLGLFLQESFNGRPDLQYTEVVIEEKRIGMVTVANSAGQGSPIMTVKPSTSGQYFQTNELWYRKGDQNVICRPSENTDILNWFLGSKHRVKDTQGEAQNQPSVGHGDNSSSESTNELRFLDSFRKGHFVLIVGRIPSCTPNLEALMKFPWLYVFDFDIDSRDSGTLAGCEIALRKKKAIFVKHWGVSPIGPSEHATTWCFVRGVRDIPESRVEDDCRKWVSRTRDGIRKHCHQLAKFAADYTTLRILIVWPNLDFCPNHLLQFMNILDEYLNATIEINISSEPHTLDGKNVRHSLGSLLGINPTIPVSVEKLCHEINTHFDDSHNKLSPNQKLRARCSDKVVDVEITDSDQLWYKDDLDVLYLENPFTKSFDNDDISEDIDNFFKGGTIHWFTWYECGAGHNDIQRQAMDSILQELERLCETQCKPTVITLLHAPGSGGTTLAQRLLWELHTKTPCAQVKVGMGSTLDQLVAKIEHLNKITGMTIVLLLDGEEESRVKQLKSQLARISTIILYVKRYPYPFKSHMAGQTRYHLKGEVTAAEANRLSMKLKDRIQDTQRKSALDKLTADVSENKAHCMYEFGLTAYLHEFRGISSYVRGYLKLDQNPSRDLLEWQKILGYLALVYYYGQASVPCQFFAMLLGKPPNYDISVSDFPTSAREFIREDTTKPKYIRTSHYIISQEILEQILTRHRSDANPRNQQDLTSLTKLAKQNLKDFAEDFIEYSSRKKTKRGPISTTVTYILTKTFILREYKDTTVGPNEVHRKKPIISNLLSDIPSSPPFTERLRIHEKLSQSFPEDPNFHAHLGRFYTYWRPEDAEKAEQCFEKALEKCEKLDTNDEKVKQTLMHVYHMYGTIYTRRVKAMTKDKYADDETWRMQNNITTLFKHTQKACDLFGKCREWTPLGQEQCCGYVGEMSARLQLCVAIETAFGDLQKYITQQSSDPEIVEFLTTSVSVVDSIIMECYHYVDVEELGRSFYEMVRLFNITFNKDARGLEGLCLPEDSASRRLKIAAKKMKYCQNSKEMLALEPVSAEDITEIIRLYESNFREVQETGDIDNRKALDMDYKEWVMGIRHIHFQPNYSLEDVRVHMCNWRENLGTPFSLFYLFVVTSLVGFGSNSDSTKEFILEKAIQLKEELRKESKYMPHPRYPREWLGTGEGIRQLVPGTLFPHGHIDSVKRNIKGRMEPMLAVCKGTICARTKALSGLIDLDLGRTPVAVKVFFVPRVCNLEGQRFQGERVEFRLAFTLDKGYEAFNVRPLKKLPCPCCKTLVEIRSDEAEVTCPPPCKTTISKRESDPLEGYR